jgi:hypothetical protein
MESLLRTNIQLQESGFKYAENFREGPFIQGQAHMNLPTGMIEE